MNREKIKEQLSEHFSAWEELTETEQEDLLANSQLVEYKKVSMYMVATQPAPDLFLF